jgi:hypothetical protein
MDSAMISIMHGMMHPSISQVSPAQTRPFGPAMDDILDRGVKAIDVGQACTHLLHAIGASAAFSEKGVVDALVEQVHAITEPCFPEHFYIHDRRLVRSARQKAHDDYGHGHASWLHHYHDALADMHRHAHDIIYTEASRHMIAYFRLDTEPTKRCPSRVEHTAQGYILTTSIRQDSLFKENLDNIHEARAIGRHISMLSHLDERLVPLSDIWNDMIRKTDDFDGFSKPTIPLVHGAGIRFLKQGSTLRIPTSIGNAFSEVIGMHGHDAMDHKYDRVSDMDWKREQWVREAISEPDLDLDAGSSITS